MKKTLFTITWVILFFICNNSLLSAASPTQGLIQGSIWIANEGGNSITVINAGTKEVTATLSGVGGPHNLQVSPDGKSVWVVSGHGSKAIMIDGTSYTAHESIQTGNHPAHVIVSPDGKRVYVTNGGDNSVSIIDVETMTSIREIPVGQYPHGLRPSPDGKRVFVANINSDTLSVIDTASETRVADVPVGKKPVQVAFSPDGKFVYASLNGENALVKLDVEKLAIVGKVKVGIGPIQVSVTPDNTRVVVANQGTEQQPSSTVSIVEVQTFSVIDTVETGKGAHGVVIDPSGAYAFITNIYSNNVSVLDLSSRKTIANIPTGEKPNGISFSTMESPKPSTPVINMSIKGHETKH